MKKLNLVVLSLTCISLFGFGQSDATDPVIIAVAGTSDENETISLEWTIGESAVQTVTLNDRIYTEGFHQPELLAEVVLAEGEIPVTGYNITVAPNPVRSLLNFSINSEIDSKVHLTLTDLNGKVLTTDQANSKSDSKNLDMGSFASGIYLLNIKNNAGSTIQTYKISKIQ